MADLAPHLLDTAVGRGQRPALGTDDAVRTDAGFRDAAAGVAAGLRAPGDRAGMVLPDVVRSPAAVHGAPRHLWLVDALPEGPTGTRLRRAVEVPTEVAE